MTDYGYTDPRSIYSQESRKKARTRTPDEILKSVRKQDQELGREDLLKYWCNPSDGLNDSELYLTPDGWLRSVRLFETIRALIAPDRDPRILELGSNVGRNLIMLKFGGYKCLTGIELSECAISLMRKTFSYSTDVVIHAGEIEKLIYNLGTDSFDIIFTMAVLEHLPPESEHVFKEIVRVTKKYLVIIEDERCVSWRHFPRRYDSVFKKLGMKQVRVIKNMDGLSKSFVCRIFKKEAVQQ